MSNSLDKYEQVRDRMKTGDCLLYQSKGILGRVIRTFSPVYNHAGLVLALPEYCGKENRRWTLEALDHGICLNLLSEDLAKYDGSAWWLPLKPEFEDRRDQIGEYALANAGKPYDFKGLFANIFGYVSVNAKQFFCSEYAFLAYRAAGIVTGDKAPRPGDIPGLGIFGDLVQIV